MPGTFFLPPQDRDPDVHHGSCVTHVSWYMLESLAIGFFLSWCDGENVFSAPAQPPISPSSKRLIISYIAEEWELQDIHLTMNSQKTPHTLPLQASYGDTWCGYFGGNGRIVNMFDYVWSILKCIRSHHWPQKRRIKHVQLFKGPCALIAWHPFSPSHLRVFPMTCSSKICTLCTSVLATYIYVCI